MSDVTVIGDGPTGLSAALLLAKNDASVTVFGQDETRMHKAYLYNYLGIREIHGSDFMEIARDQCDEYGVDTRDEHVDGVESTGDGFTVSAESGTVESEYVVVATGLDRELGESLGLEYDGEAISADKNGRTSVDNVYAGGWAIRPDKIQAAISVGDGAAIALDILSDIKGEPFHDFDVPE